MRFVGEYLGAKVDEVPGLTIKCDAEDEEVDEVRSRVMVGWEGEGEIEEVVGRKNGFDLDASGRLKFIPWSPTEDVVGIGEVVVVLVDGFEPRLAEVDEPDMSM